MSISQLADNQIFRFLSVGIVGNILGWAIYAIVYDFVTIDSFRPTISWLISFHFGVALQHHLHRYFTFEDVDGDYFSSLIRTYFSYIGLLFYGLIVNYSLNELLNIYHHASYFLTLVAAVPASYILLKKFAFKE